MGLDDQLRAVADELEIRNLVAKLAHLADDGDLAEYIQLFTEDAVWEGNAFGVRRGRADILAGAAERRAGGTSGPGANTRHVVGTTTVSLTGDEATGRSVFRFYTETNALPKLAILGVYQDTFRRTPQGWKLAHREIHGPPAAGS